MSNVISVAGGTQGEAESLHGRESLFLQVLGEGERNKKPQLKKKNLPKNEKGILWNLFFR